MEIDFDKEMDSLLRQAARNGPGLSNNLGAHLDADEISLFAENALPAKIRATAMEHLADCDRCRKILSNVISFNAEVESENVNAKETVATVIPVPWYKKLFGFPQLAYAMGALVLVFSGIIAVVVLQNAYQSGNSSIAQMEKVQDKQTSGKAMSSDDQTSTVEAYPTPSASTNANTSVSSTSNMSMSNTTSTNTMTRSAAPTLTTNSNATGSVDEKQVLAERDDKADRAEPTLAAPVPPSQNKPAEATKKEEFVEDKAEKESRRVNELPMNGRQQQPELSQNTTVQNQAGIVPDSRNVQRSAAKTVDSLKSVSPSADADVATTAAGNSKDSKAKSAPRKTLATRSAGGKTFNFRDGAWYDSAYSNQQTTNVRRSTDDYKKLDGGLRSIAENIGGVVVVVWKSKVYRIQ